MIKRRHGLWLSTRRSEEGARANRDEQYDEMVHTWSWIGIMTITGSGMGLCNKETPVCEWLGFRSLPTYVVRTNL